MSGVKQMTYLCQKCKGRVAVKDNYCPSCGSLFLKDALSRSEEKHIREIYHRLSGRDFHSWVNQETVDEVIAELQPPSEYYFFGKKWYRLRESGLFIFGTTEFLIGPGGKPTPKGSLALFNMDGELLEVIDNLGSGLYERGASQESLSRDFVDYFENEDKLTPVDLSDIMAMVKWVVYSW